MGLPAIVLMSFALADGAPAPDADSAPAAPAAAQVESTAEHRAEAGAPAKLAAATTKVARPDAEEQAEQPTEPFARLMSREREELLRGSLPKVDDPDVQAMLNDPTLILYTDVEMPGAYQFWDGALQGVHRVDYNISADNSEPFGNGNREFPWATPAGTHRTNNVRTVRFLWLPRDDAGKPWPVVWYRRHLSGDGTLGYAWTFPIGTVFGEVLMMRAPDGYDYTFEMRLRRREGKEWSVDVFRPFPTAEDLAQRIRELRPDWDEQPNLTAFVAHLEEPNELPVLKLADRQPARRTFDQAMGVDVLPPLEDEALVCDLLRTTTFRSALGATWRWGSNGARTCAPTTDAPFHIVPARYDAGFVDVDRASCIRCHETVNADVDRFDFSRDWYGRIRGSDGIFSFHPFDPHTVSGNGFGQAVRMRPELTEAGVLERFDSDRHPGEVYTRIVELRE